MHTQLQMEKCKSTTQVHKITTGNWENNETKNESKWEICLAMNIKVNKANQFRWTTDQNNHRYNY